MSAHHKACFIALAAASAALAFSAPVSAAAFDPHRCSAIQNVDVPYDVNVDADRIVFKSGGRQIVVAPAYTEVNGRRFANAGLNRAYYRDVGAFLQSAGAFPKTAAEFGKSAFLPGQSEAKQNFLGGITGMCRAILTLAGDQKRMHEAFADFVSPVEIALSSQPL